MISAAETNLRMAADTQLLELQYFDHKRTIMCMAFMPGNQFFYVAQHYPERRVLFLSTFLSQGLTQAQNGSPYAGLIRYFLKIYVYTPSTPCRDVKFCPNISLGDLS